MHARDVADSASGSQEPGLVNDRISRARIASARCRDHLEKIHDRSDSGDRLLAEFLSDLVMEETRSESRLGALSARAAPAAGTTADFGLGEGRLDRDSALYFAEIAEKKRTEVFFELACGLPDGAVRTLLLGEAERGCPRLILIRNILLMDASGIRSLAALPSPLRGWLSDALARLVIQVREGRKGIQNLRSVYDRGVAVEAGREGPYSVLLDALGRPPGRGAFTLSAGLRQLAGSRTAENTLAIARALLASLVGRLE